MKSTESLNLIRGGYNSPLIAPASMGESLLLCASSAEAPKLIGDGVANDDFWAN